MKTILGGMLAAVVLATAAHAGEVDRRAERQQDRIAQGVKSGQMTAGEAARVEGKEAKINSEVQADRAANGGKLTKAERRKVNREQNRASRQIHREKHNARHQ